MTFDAATTIDRPPSVVWSYISDVKTWPKWASSYLELKQTSDGPIGVGATFQSSHPMNRTLVERLVEYETNRSFGLEFISGPIRGSRVWFRMEGTAGVSGSQASQVTRTFEMRFAGIFKLLGPLLIARSFKREGPIELGNLKRTIESRGST